MIFSRTEIPDVILCKPSTFEDDRGYFLESYRKNSLDEFVGKPLNFCQDNESKSTRGVLRGLHYQLPPHAQGKLVRVVQGEVFDVAVDIRKSSPTYGQWVAETLSAENKKQLWIPEGFAHGFLTLSETAEFLYKTNNYYSFGSERCIRWNDGDLGILWPKHIGVSVSAKDASGITFENAEIFS